MIEPEDRGLAAFYEATCARQVRWLMAAGATLADAEEIAQDAYVRLVPRWGAVSHYDDPESWIRSVAMRLLISRARRAKVARLGLQQLTSRRATYASEPGDLAVEQALQQLPLQQRAVVVLHHLLDLSVEQVADELKIPAGTVKSRLSRARAVLKPLLSDDEEHDRV